MTSLHLKSENNWEKHEDLMKESKQYYISQYITALAQDLFGRAGLVLVAAIFVIACFPCNRFPAGDDNSLFLCKIFLL